ncbi:MAG: hypothetical protein QMD10_10965 [Desulfitobacteriaceae bacterium]|nr:hypothetical protein [Desulfitobacteriaceae bacterium]
MRSGPAPRQAHHKSRAPARLPYLREVIRIGSLREYLTEPKKIKSPLVGEVYLALDGDSRVPSGSVCYFYSEIAYMTAAGNSRTALGTLHRLKKHGIRPVLDSRPDYPDTAAWTALLTFVESDELRKLLLALREVGALRLGNDFKVRPAPGYEDVYAYFRPQLLTYTKDMKNALGRLRAFFTKAA